MADDNMFHAAKSKYTSECKDDCAFTVYSRERDISLRWRKNNNGYGGRIQINYNTVAAGAKTKEYVFGGKAYKGSGTAFIDFMNYDGITINGTEPDAVVRIGIEPVGGGTNTPGPYMTSSISYRRTSRAKATPARN
jgi:hypothetical protein